MMSGSKNSRKYIELEDDDDEEGEKERRKGSKMQRRDSGIGEDGIDDEETKEAKEEEDCLITVYTDGSFRPKNDRSQCPCLSRAGYGVYFPAFKKTNQTQSPEMMMWGRIPGVLQNSRRAEIYATIRAIQLCPEKDAKLHIFTDYQTTVMMKSDYRTWSTRKTSDMDLWTQLRREMYLRKHVPTLSHVKGHSGNYGNDIADKYAKKGTDIKCEKDGCRVTMKQIGHKIIQSVEILDAL